MAAAGAAVTHHMIRRRTARSNALHRPATLLLRIPRLRRHDPAGRGSSPAWGLVAYSATCLAIAIGRAPMRARITTVLGGSEGGAADRLTLGSPTRRQATAATAAAAAATAAAHQRRIDGRQGMRQRRDGDMSPLNVPRVPFRCCPRDSVCVVAQTGNRHRDTIETLECDQEGFGCHRRSHAVPERVPDASGRSRYIALDRFVSCSSTHAIACPNRIGICPAAASRVHCSSRSRND